VAIINYSPEHIRLIAEVEKEVHKALENLARREGKPPEAALIIFALVRQARRLLVGYPEGLQSELLDPIISFLRQDQVKGAMGKIITLQ
jgi:hypothetical protein